MVAISWLKFRALFPSLADILPVFKSSISNNCSWVRIIRFYIQQPMNALDRMGWRMLGQSESRILEWGLFMLSFPNNVADKSKKLLKYFSKNELEFHAAVGIKWIIFYTSSSKNPSTIFFIYYHCFGFVLYVKRPFNCYGYFRDTEALTIFSSCHSEKCGV